MSLPIDLPVMDSKYLGKAEITADETFIYPTDQMITLGDLNELISYHRSNMQAKYQRYRKYYSGKHDIADKTKHPAKAAYKPDNRLIVNLPKKIVNSYNGYFIGTPVKIDSPETTTDKFITDWQNQNNFEDVNMEVAKEAALYGRAYYWIYQGEDSQPHLTFASPLDTFIIYDNTMAQEPLYAVHYTYNASGELQVLLYTKQYQINIDGLTADGTQLTVPDKGLANPYNMLPIIELPENQERMALCADLMSIFDGIDKAMSEKSNDVDYFADAYLKIIGASLNEDQLKDLRANRLINIQGEEAASTAQVDFLAKPDADATQEHLIDRLVDYVYQVAQVVNLNDEAFAGNPTGVALRMKYQPMQDMANVKSLKMNTALRQVFECVFSVISTVQNDAWSDLSFKYTQSIPVNLLELSQAAKNFTGVISNKTLFGQMPFIDDPDQEIKQIADEQQQSQQQTAGLMQNLINKAGENNGSDEATDSQADKAAPETGQTDGSTNGHPLPTDGSGNQKPSN